MTTDNGVIPILPRLDNGGYDKEGDVRRRQDVHLGVGMPGGCQTSTPVASPMQDARAVPESHDTPAQAAGLLPAALHATIVNGILASIPFFSSQSRQTLSALAPMMEVARRIP